MEKDVIISVFATSAQAPTEQWARQYFSDPPLIINLSNPSQFRFLAQSWAKTGDLFSAALKRPDITIRRRGLVTFSAGWTFGDELLKISVEREKLDVYLLVDGCHTESLEHWIKFAEKAAACEKIFFLAHTEIQPPFISTTKSNSLIFQEACARNDVNLDVPRLKNILPDYLVRAELEEPVTISLGKSGDLPAISKTYHHDTLKDSFSRGELIRLHYAGNDRPDHVYLAWKIQERMWRYLGESWSNSEI